MTIAEKLKTARKQAKLTRKQIFEKYEIPVSTLVCWEREERLPPDYVINLLLRCMAIDFPSVQDLSEPTYVFTDPLGKPLSPKLAELVKAEYLAGKVEEQPEHTQNFYEDPVTTVNNRGKLYLCTDPKPSLDLDPENEIPMGFVFRVKEV